MGTGDCINIFMATQPCHTANGYWGLHQMFFYGYSALSHCKWELGSAPISSWLLSPVTLQMGTGDCINIFMAVQPCNTANGYWGLHQYLYGYSALSHCKWELEIASISSWLLSPVTPANGYWGFHQYLHGYSALSHCKWELGSASISSWLLSPVTPANGYWGFHQYLHGYSALSHCKWELGSASISSWLLSPVTLQMGTGDCINIFMAVQPCNTANGYWGLHQYLYGYSALSHCKWELEIASISSWLLSPVTPANGYRGLHQYLHGC